MEPKETALEAARRELEEDEPEKAVGKGRMDGKSEGF